MRQQIKVHLTDPPYSPPPNVERLENVDFVVSGTRYGRILFTDVTLLQCDVKRKLEIANCSFIGGDTAVIITQ